MSQKIDIEIAHLNLRYEHTRIRRPQAVLCMAQSIERFGQIVPVVVVDAGPTGHVLIDGYLRVKALKQLGADLVAARQWSDTESAALISLLARMQQRNWDLYEQAAILQELRLGHQLSCADMARLLGKDKSWVARRLMLFDTLDDGMIALVRNGVISAWSAQRVLVPWARANAEHAVLVAAALKKENIPTRKLAVFFDHYKRSNRKTRQNMADDPHLFLKALEASTADSNAHMLRQGPEGRFFCDLRTVSHILLRLIKAVPQVLYCGQEALQRRRLLTAYAEAAALMQTLSRDIDDDQQSTAPANFNLASNRLQDPAYQPPGEGIAQHRAPCH
jgi:ParB family transcriptional regulator, chromosome partitioning protein